jgi:hypothetical protein
MGKSIAINVGKGCINESTPESRSPMYRLHKILH